MKMSKEQELQWKVDYLKESLKQIKATIVGVKMGYANKDWVDGKMMDSFCDLIDNSLFNSK
jgi:Uri superfamily endonuclease